MSGSKTPIIAGQRFGLLTTISVCGRSNDGHKLWSCKCDCGVIAVKSTNNLRCGFTPNCGCYGRAAQVNSHTKHGMRNSRTYSSWQAAKNRCHTPTSKDFPKYGARGIVMCERWRNSFEDFLFDMGERPRGRTLDRYPDRNGNYEPSNCRWATASEQVRNRSISTWVVWRGKNTHLADVAAELGITFGAASMRLKRGKLHEELHDNRV